MVENTRDGTFRHNTLTLEPKDLGFSLKNTIAEKFP